MTHQNGDKLANVNIAILLGILKGDFKIMSDNAELENPDNSNDVNRVTEIFNTPSDDEVVDGVKPDGDAADNAQDAEKVKPKRIIRNPQPKFNEGTLRGHRGLLALSRISKRINMKGRGHEKEDLSAIMRTYAYWCHRMIPKYPFGDCIEKLEKLGRKKGTVAYMQRIRSGLLEDETIEESTSNVVDNEDGDDSNDANLDTNMTEEESVNSQVIPEVSPIEISDDVMEIIRVNRERALQIRANKQREEAAALQMNAPMDEIEIDE